MWYVLIEDDGDDDDAEDELVAAYDYEAADYGTDEEPELPGLTDEAVRLVPPIQMSLEYAVEFIEDDELVEITPKSIRLRKRFLKEHERKKASREA